MAINTNVDGIRANAASGVKIIGKSGYSFFSNFIQFINRGNVVDLAVGIAIGSAFTAIVNSLVADIFTPVISITGEGAVTLSEKFVLLKDGKNKTGSYTTLAAAKEAGAITLNYGNFLQTVINFFIIAAVLFIVIQLFQNIIRKKKDQKTDPCPFCLEAIPKGALRCKFCTSDLRNAFVTGSQPSEALLSERNPSEMELLHKKV